MIETACTVQPGLLLVQRSGHISTTYHIIQAGTELGELHMNGWNGRAALVTAASKLHVIDRDADIGFRINECAEAHPQAAWNRIELACEDKLYAISVADQQSYTLEDEHGKTLMRTSFGSRAVFPAKCLVEVREKMSLVLAGFALFLVIAQRRRNASWSEVERVI